MLGLTRLAAVSAATGFLAIGCSAPSAVVAVNGGPDPTQTITVFAAASLKPSFTELGNRFEAAYPGTRIAFNFAGSQTLLTQLQEGGPADVFAAADERSMAIAAKDGLLNGEATLFASNRLIIAVPPDNPANIQSLRDLTDSKVKLVVCAPVVPCGAATKVVEQSAGLTLRPVSEEQAVSDVLGKVQTGEADAGLVYITDVKSAGDTVKGIEFPESSLAVNHDPIAVIASSRSSLASAFVAFVTGPEGQQVLAEAGFGKP